MPVLDWKELQNLVNERQTGEVDYSNEPWLDGWDATAPDASQEYDRRFKAYMDAISPRNINNVVSGQELIESQAGDYTQEALELGYGTRSIDRKIPYDIFRQNPDEARAYRQTQLGKFVNGTLKAIPTLATTFADNTVGILASMLPYTPVGQLVENNTDVDLGDFVQTPFGQAMQSVRDWSENFLPNYRTQEEIDDASHWWRHLNGNFWGDVFMKNLGFTIGAGLSGGVYAKAFNRITGSAVRNAYKAAIAASTGDAEAMGVFQKLLSQSGVATKDIGKLFDSARKSYQALNIGAQAVGGLGGAIGEARVEALGAAQEHRNKYQQELQQKYIDDKQQLEYDIWSNDNNITTRPVFDGFGNKIGDEPVLKPEAEDAYLKALQGLQDDYASSLDTVEKEAERIANNVFWFNVPVVGGSNAIMFGKALTGGFKTASKFKLRGTPGNYVGAGSTASAIAGNLGRSAMEGVEEVTQKVISTGLQDVADKDMAAFYNEQYDTESVQSLADWVQSISGSAGDVLTDPQTSQEFVVGLMTGLLADTVQGGWGSSIRQNRENQAKADELNRRMQDQEFAALWTGMVRHNYLEKQKDAALDAVVTDKNGNTWRGDEFTWHNENDKQLISDIIMFADAGRLDDLRDVVDAAANVKPEDIDNYDLIDESDPQFKGKNAQQKVEFITKRAQQIKDGIRQYEQMYDAIDPLVVGTTDPDVINELLFTQIQINNFEKRYHTILDEVYKAIEPKLRQVASQTDNMDKPTQEAQQAMARLNAKSTLEKLFGRWENEINEDATLFPIELDSKTQQKAISELDKLGVFANNDKLKKQVTDLGRLVRSRQTYYHKLVNPNFVSEFNKAKKGPETVINNVNQQAADANTAGLNTFADVKSAFLAKDIAGRQKFAEDLNGSTNQYKEEFNKLYSTFNNFRSALAHKYPKLVNRSTGGFNRIAEMVLDTMFSNAASDTDFVNRLDFSLMSLADVNAELARLVNAGVINDDEALPVMVDKVYSDTVNAIKDVTADFKSSWNNSTGRQNVQTQQPTQGSPDDDNTNPEPAVAPELSTQTQTQTPTTQAQQPETESQSETEQEEEPEPVTVEEGEADTNSTYEDTMPEESDSYVRDNNGSSKMGYYQQSIPEIPLTQASQARELLMQRKTASKEEIEYIDQQLASLNLSDFVQFDENGNAVGGEVGYAPTYKWLKDNGAFDYIATQLAPNDKVVFAIMDGTPEYEGKKQIVVAVVKERNEAGEITSVQPITILHDQNKSGRYLHLKELYNAISSDYESTEPDGSLYIFGGKTNPYISKVWGIQPGLMRYNKSSDGTRIDQIENYDPNAPIIIMNKNNEPVVLRGSVDVSKMRLPNLYPWSRPHSGRMYYMVKNGGDSYVPVLLTRIIPENEEFEPVTRKNINQLISDGLIISNAEKLRQVGVNFMIDPWNGKDKFERVLPSTQEESAPIPKTEVQKVATDAEMGGEPIAEQPAAPTAQAQVQDTNPPSVEIVSDDLDVLFGEETQPETVDEAILPFDKLSDSASGVLQSKGVTKERWNSVTNIKLRRKWLTC